MVYWQMWELLSTMYLKCKLGVFVKNVGKKLTWVQVNEAVMSDILHFKKYVICKVYY